MTPQARAIITEVARLHGVPYERIVVAGRVQKIFRARMAAAIRLDAETGYTTTQLGKILGCDHTMILYYLGRLKKKPSCVAKPRWRAPKVRPFHKNMGMRKKPHPNLITKPPLRRYAGFDINERRPVLYYQPSEERT